MRAPTCGGWWSTNDGSSRQAAKSPSPNPSRVTRLRYTAGMIWSVSTLLRRSGSARPVWATNGSMSYSLQVGRRGQPAGDGGGGGDGGGHQVSAPALALAAFEVPVRGRGGPLPRLERVRVHAQAHRAPGAAPFGPGRGEDLVEPLALGLRANLHGTGDDKHPDAVRDLPAADHVGGGAQILDPAVGAGADEHGVDRDLLERRAGRQAHVGEGALGGVRVLGLARRRDGGAKRQRLARGGAPGEVRRERGRVDRDLVVEDGALVGPELAPVGHRRVPVGALGRVLAALQVLERDLVRRDQAGPRARLDRHVA